MDDFEEFWEFSMATIVTCRGNKYVFRPPATCHGNTQPDTPALGGWLVGYKRAGSGRDLLTKPTSKASPGWKSNVAEEYSCFSIGADCDHH
jgi:hypothetical protein